MPRGVRGGTRLRQTSERGARRGASLPAHADCALAEHDGSRAIGKVGRCSRPAPLIMAAQ